MLWTASVKPFGKDKVTITGPQREVLDYINTRARREGWGFAAPDEVSEGEYLGLIQVSETKHRTGFKVRYIDGNEVVGTYSLKKEV